MNINKFTQKSMEAVQNCEKLAYEYGNQQIDQQHLLYSLLTLDDSLILKLVTKMGIQGDMFTNEAKQAVERLTKVSGGGQLYISNDLNKVLINGEDEAKAMGDEYVSVEHLFLALLKHPNKEIKGLMKLYNITRETFLQALSTVRGNQRVVSDNPEATYDTLQKYGYDLVERARDQKLDPVIGRDSEIRNVVRILSRKTKNNPVLIGEPGVGKTAVVEGVGDHGCEYMTGGRVVVLGPTGKNFAAGMSGGIAYVLDEKSDLYKRLNKELVSFEDVTNKYDVSELKEMIKEHVAYTNSAKGKEILDNFGHYLPKFKKILPHDYRRMMNTIVQMEEKGLSSEQAQIEAFYANTRK